MPPGPPRATRAANNEPLDGRGAGWQPRPPPRPAGAPLALPLSHSPPSGILLQRIRDTKRNNAPWVRPSATAGDIPVPPPPPHTHTLGSHIAPLCNCFFVVVVCSWKPISWQGSRAQGHRAGSAGQAAPRGAVGGWAPLGLRCRSSRWMLSTPVPDPPMPPRPYPPPCPPSHTDTLPVSPPPTPPLPACLPR